MAKFEVELCFLCLLFHSGSVLVALKFSEVRLGLRDAAQIAAFADFNSDTATDILALNSTGSTQQLHLWNTKESEFVQVPLKLDVPFPVSSVQVGDFNGDGLVDLLTLTPPTAGEGCVSAWVHWMGLSSGGVPEERTNVASSHAIFNTTSSGLLMVLDINGDHIPDVLSTTCEGILTVWVSQGQNKSFIPLPLEVGGGREGEPRQGDYVSGNYLDLNGDCLPELVLLRSESKQRWLDVWTREDGNSTLRFKSTLYLPLGAPVMTSHLSFVDMNVDGQNEAVMVVCNEMDKSLNLCVNTSILILFQAKSSQPPEQRDVINCAAPHSWSLNFTRNVSISVPEGLGVALEGVASYPVLGDWDLDSYADLALPVTNLTRQTSDVLFLMSIGSHGSSFHRPQWSPMSGFAFNNLTKVAIFDLWEDGVLDVLVRHGNTSEGVRWSALQQSLGADHTFLKILVLSGYCYTDCTSGLIPYGSVLPAASVAYSTTDRNGHKQQTSISTRPSSDPLQLPFVLFGLGETPNFIAKLSIRALYQAKGGHAGAVGRMELGQRTWRNLVPNSQVIVIPSPPDKPGSWRVELYLTPSRLMFSTAGVLCALAVGLAIIIALLHAREKYQDRQERKQAKHKFHFNAM